MLSGCDTGPTSELARPGPVVLGSSPADGDVDVSRRSVFRVRVDRRLSPESVGGDTVRVVSGDRQLLLSVHFDPVESQIVALPFGSQALEARVTYRLEVDGVRDLDGVAQEQPYVAAFVTSGELGDVPRRPTASFAEAGPILTAACTGEACHGPGPAALGLDLSTPEGVRTTAVGIPARQVAAGTLGVEGRGGARGLAGMRNVDALGGVGSPSTSYLLYKVLGDPHIVGEPMPPDGPLEEEAIRTLSRWIVAGAPLE